MHGHGESTATLLRICAEFSSVVRFGDAIVRTAAWPTLPDGLAQIVPRVKEVQRDLESLQDLPGWRGLLRHGLRRAQARLTALVSDADHMSTLPERNATLASLRERGFADFIDDMVERGIEPSHIAAELDLAYTTAVFEEIIATTPTVASLSPLDIRPAGEIPTDRAHADPVGPVLRAVVNNARETIAISPPRHPSGSTKPWPRMAPAGCVTRLRPTPGLCRVPAPSG